MAANRDFIVLVAQWQNNLAILVYMVSYVAVSRTDDRCVV